MKKSSRLFVAIVGAEAQVSSVHGFSFNSMSSTTSVQNNSCGRLLRLVKVPALHVGQRSELLCLLKSDRANEEELLHHRSANRRTFINQIATYSSLVLMPLQPAQSIDDEQQAPFHSAAYGLEEYTNSIVASRDTNVSPKEVYDTISSDFLKEAYEAAMKETGRKYGPRALDVGAGAGVSTEVLYKLGYHEIDALDWSGSAWEKYVIEDPSGYCPPSVNFYALDDERYLDKWRQKYKLNNKSGDDGLFDVIVFNFAVNEAKASQFAGELLNKEHGRLLAPINTSNDYWLKQTYKVMNSKGEVLWDAVDVGAWSVQFQPDVTQDTVSSLANVF